MAKDAKPEAEGAAVAPKKGKKLLIVIVAALVLVLALGGGGYMVWKKMHPADEEDETEVAAAKPKAEKKKGAKEAGPIYIALDQFTVNLAPDNGDQFLQVMISVEVEDTTVGDRLKSYTPKLRNNVTFTYYPSGHMVYLNVDALKQFKSDLAKFYDSAAPR